MNIGNAINVIKDKMVNIIFETHSTTLDNEAHLSSGQNDVVLSPAGEKQAKELIMLIFP